MKELESRDILRLTKFFNHSQAINLFIPTPIVVLDYSHVGGAGSFDENMIMYFGNEFSLVESEYYAKFWVKIKSK